MAEIIRMPEVLAGAAEAAIETWLVAAGSSVVLGQSLAEIETDKATVELNAESPGTVGRLLVAEGLSVSVGDPILVLVAEGEGEAEIESALAEAGHAGRAVEPTKPTADTTDRSTADPKLADGSHEASPAGAHGVTTAQTGAAQTNAPPPPAAQAGRVFASPIVRKLASDGGVSLADVTGTGPHGRIVRRDLEQYLTEGHRADSAVLSTKTAGAVSVPPAGAAAGEPEFEDIPLGRMRKAIARRLTESKSSVPHFYLVAECRVDTLLETRRTINQSVERKVSVNDFIVKAVAGALVEVPDANAVWNGDSIRRFVSVDIAVAVAIDGGLVTPVLRGVERMTLTEVSSAVADVAERGRRGELKQHEIVGGSFAVSNLGMYGTKEFSAILNPPQAGILAVGAARSAPVVDEGGQLAIGQLMTVTLSADHRVLDGAMGAEWLAAFQRRIENPLSTLI